MGRGVRYLHSSVGVATPYDVIYGAWSPLFTRPRWLYHASLCCQMGRGVRYLHGLVGFIMHLYDVRWGAESAIYTASLAWPCIVMMLNEARSPLFTQSHGFCLESHSNFVRGFCIILSAEWRGVPRLSISYGAESAIYTVSGRGVRAGLLEIKVL